MKGHLRKRSKDSWTIVLDLGRDHRDKRKQKWMTIRGTKKDAQTAQAKMIAEIENGTYLEPSKTPLSDYLDQWLDSIQGNVSKKTLERYEQLVNKQITPYLGHIKLNKLQPHTINELYSTALVSGRADGKGGLSKQSVLHIHRVLHRALGQAVKWALIIRNPCDAVDPPKPDKRERQTFTTEETVELLRAAKGNRLYLPILLAVTTGMRRGEILGLRWKDIDLKNYRIQIRRMISETRKYGVEVKSPKTDKSSRSIALPQIAVLALKEYKKEQSERNLFLGRGLTGDTILFDDISGFEKPSCLTTAFRAFIKSKGLKRLTFHDLRHTHATHLLEQNIHPKVVAERLGHSSIALTINTYSHVMPNMQDAAAKAIDSVIFLK